jgi:hypothetical protein
MWYKINWIYVWSQKVRPAQQPWTPWTDTVAYRPFTDDYNDYSWNNYNVTSQGSTILTTLNGVKCLNLNESSCQVSSVDTLGSYSNYTMSLWARLIPDSNPWQIWRNYSESWSWGWGWITLARTDVYAQIRRGNAYNRYSPISWHQAGVWFNFILTVLNGEGIIYVNWTKNVLLSVWARAPSHNGTPMRIWANEGGSTQANGYVSRLILEKKWWTEEEATSYYNSTKSIYGL